MTSRWRPTRLCQGRPARLGLWRAFQQYRSSQRHPHAAPALASRGKRGGRRGSQQVNLLEQVVAEAKIHPQFADLRRFEGYAPSRAQIDEIAGPMTDTDGQLRRASSLQGSVLGP